MNVEAWACLAFMVAFFVLKTWFYYHLITFDTAAHGRWGSR